MGKAKHEREEKLDVDRDLTDRRETPKFAKFMERVEQFVKTSADAKQSVKWSTLRRQFENDIYVCRNCLHQKIGEAVEWSNHLKINGRGIFDLIEYSEKGIIEVYHEKRSVNWARNYPNKSVLADLGL